MKKQITYKFHSRRNQRGQAITELVVSLMAILSVLLGLLLISALGIESVRNVMKSRELADNNASNGRIVEGDRGRTIRQWNYGNDEIPFTTDDSPDSFMSDDGQFYLPHLVTTNGELDMNSSFGNTSYLENGNNFAKELSVTDIFVTAATLSVGKGTQKDPLGERGLGDLKTAIKRLIINTDFELKDTSYVPSRPDRIQLP